MPLRVALAAALAAVLVAGAPAAAVSVGTAALPPYQTTLRAHPDFSTPNPYSIFTFDPGGGDEDAARMSALAGEGFSRLDWMVSPFMNDSGTVGGDLYSEVWSDGGANRLFLYRLENTGTHSFHHGNVYRFELDWNIVDSGVVTTASTFAPGIDPIAIARYEDQHQVEFYFSVLNTYGDDLAAGATSSWFYVETDDALSYVVGQATVENGGAIGSIPAIVPSDVVIPEPLTMAGVLAGLGGLAVYLRRRRADVTAREER